MSPSLFPIPSLPFPPDLSSPAPVRCEAIDRRSGPQSSTTLARNLPLFIDREGRRPSEEDKKTMGRLFLMSLAATGRIYCCKHCNAHLAYATDIVSKSFRCKHGKAYLFHKVVNVNAGESDDRMMTTGLHTVCDIFCVGCGSILGWKYLAAFDKGQRYKEGKFILERCKVSAPTGGTQQLWAEHDARASESDDDDQDAV